MDNFEDIKYIAGQLNQIYKTMYAINAPEVKRIIKNKITDCNVIEACLDNLLNCPTDDCYDLLLELCAYYKAIDEKTAKEYIQLFRELYLGEEEPKTKKRK